MELSAGTGPKGAQPSPLLPSKGDELSPVPAASPAEFTLELSRKF